MFKSQHIEKYSTICLKIHCFVKSAEDGALITIDVRLAYRDDTVSEWTEMAHSFEKRKLNCNFTTLKVGKTLSISQQSQKTITSAVSNFYTSVPVRHFTAKHDCNYAAK